MQLIDRDEAGNSGLARPFQELARRCKLAVNVERGDVLSRELGAPVNRLGVAVVRRGWQWLRQALGRHGGRVGFLFALIARAICLLDAVIGPTNSELVELDVAVRDCVEVVLLLKLAIDAGRGNVGAEIPAREPDRKGRIEALAQEVGVGLHNLALDVVMNLSLCPANALRGRFRGSGLPEDNPHERLVLLADEIEIARRPRA